ncbi:hypothetical protein GGF32_010079 [Allomyces javanicus]|nr:hypothetical protein GGF32_010079 [Allomyces javanicus]
MASTRPNAPASLPATIMPAHSHLSSSAGSAAPPPVPAPTTSPAPPSATQHCNSNGANRIDAALGRRLSDPNPAVRNLLITGGAGFIASFLVRKLVLLYPEWSIFVVDKLDYCASLRAFDDIRHCNNFEFIKGDITSQDFMLFLLKTKNIDTIVHLAAQTHVDNSFGNSLEFTQNNVVGTHVLLEAARVHKLHRFIHISTDEVYGDIPLTSPNANEETILSPNNPYSATKAAAECLVRAYHRSFGIPAIITRSNNVYGPGQYPEKVIPKFILLLLQDRKCPIHGDGSNARRYLYVADVAHALDLIIQRGEIGEIYNIGTDFELSNLALTEHLVGVIRPGSKSVHDHIEFVEDRAFNDRRYAIDSTKLRRLGWAPSVQFDEGIQKTIDWYRENGDKWWSHADIESALRAHPLKPPAAH